MMQEVEVLKTIQELICSFFSEEQFTLSSVLSNIDLFPVKPYNLYNCTHYLVQQDFTVLRTGNIKEEI